MKTTGGLDKSVEGEGSLVLVVGPSGAGKDSLIDVARDVLRHDDQFVFPTRMITRPADGIGERHVQISQAGFEQMKRSGAFFLSWQAHGHCYALPADIYKHLRDGRVVVANVSRQIIEEAKAIAANVSVVYVTAPKDVIANRLERRNREDSQQIKARLERYDFDAGAPGSSVTIDTSDPTEDGLQRAAARLIGLLGAAAVPASATLAGHRSGREGSGVTHQ